MKKQTVFTLLALTLSSCFAKQEPVESNDYKMKSRIAMQRVKDTDPLAKQDLVSREAMQYAMLDKMNLREDRQRREFEREQAQQREDFLNINRANTKQMEEIRDDIIESNDKLVELSTLTQNKAQNTLDEMLETNRKFSMIVSDIKAANDKQVESFDNMADKYEGILAFEEAKLERIKNKENSIRSVVENMYTDEHTAIEKFYKAQQEGMLPPSQWVNLEDSKINLHVENERFEDLILRALNHASVNAGPWQLKWKIKRENENLLFTKFNLDVETTFGEFVNNVKAYIVNYNGVRLYFRVFKEKRVLIVSDS